MLQNNDYWKILQFYILQYHIYLYKLVQQQQ